MPESQQRPEQQQQRARVHRVSHHRVRAARHHVLALDGGDVSRGVAILAEGEEDDAEADDDEQVAAEVSRRVDVDTLPPNYLIKEL